MNFSIELRDDEKGGFVDAFNRLKELHFGDMKAMAKDSTVVDYVIGYFKKEEIDLTYLPLVVSEISEHYAAGLYPDDPKKREMIIDKWWEEFKIGMVELLFAAQVEIAAGVTFFTDKFRNEKREDIVRRTTNQVFFKPDDD